MRRIALFGGSFDPPHKGHEALVHAALQRLALDEIWVIPAARPVHRQLSGLATSRQKVAWLERMFVGEQRIRIKSWELESEGPVPTVETLRRFAGLDLGVPLWLTGADAWAGIASWVDYPAHQQLCNVAVFSRVGYKLPEIGGWQACSIQAWQERCFDKPGHVLHLEVELPDVSATQIRDRALQNLPLQGLVHEAIAEEIEACYATGEID